MIEDKYNMLAIHKADSIPSHSEHARAIAQGVADKLRAPPWTRCPSTHCERSEECRSPHECSGTGAALVKREVYAAIMRERGEGEDVVQMLVLRDDEADAQLTAARADIAKLREALEVFAKAAKLYERDGAILDDDCKISAYCELTIGDLRRADRVIAEMEAGQ